MSAAVGIIFQPIDKICDLIDRFTFGGFPVGPLGAIDTSELSVFVGPLIPDSHSIFVEVFDVGLTFKEPEQFAGNGFKVDLFCR